MREGTRGDGVSRRFAPRLSRGGEDPIERQDSKELGSGRFPVPAAIGIGAGDFLIAEHLHHLIL